MTIFRKLVVLALLACLTPLVASMAAGIIASHYGCRLHEGFVNPCVIGGTDYGETLYNLAMMAWLMLFTIPMAAKIIAIWLLVEIIRKVRNRKAQT